MLTVLMCIPFNMRAKGKTRAPVFILFIDGVIAGRESEGSFTSRKNIYNGLSVNFRQIPFETIRVSRIALNKINFQTCSSRTEPDVFYFFYYYSAPLDRFCIRIGCPLTFFFFCSSYINAGDIGLQKGSFDFSLIESQR